MGSFFQELAKTLADRWLSLLVLPGAFFLGAVWLAPPSATPTRGTSLCWPAERTRRPPQ